MARLIRTEKTSHGKLRLFYECDYCHKETWRYQRMTNRKCLCDECRKEDLKGYVQMKQDNHDMQVRKEFADRVKDFICENMCAYNGIGTSDIDKILMGYEV